MSGQAWKPGDVALVKRVANASETYMIRGGEWPGLWHDGVGGKHLDSSVHSARPLVVIDPEDREQVGEVAEKFRRIAIARDDAGDPPDSTRALQDALRSLTADPKPDEPQGLGAVVKARNGSLWVFVSARGKKSAQCWRLAGVDTWRDYADIDAVEVLSQGVTP